jgi:hypothetical protein
MIRSIFIRVSLKTLVIAAILIAAFEAGASPICDAFRGDPTDIRLSNCERIVRLNLVPNKAALRYTIDYMLNNQGKLKDASCATNGINPWDKATSFAKKEEVEKGLENNCSFVINDLNKKWTKQPARNRTTGYYVDLCETDRTKLVETFYINGGSRPANDKPDVPELGRKGWNTSTLKGAFMLDGQISGDFTPIRSAPYEGIRSRNMSKFPPGGIPGIRLIGLNSSNNTTESSKPLHVTPFNTSLGCLGVSEKTIPIMEKIVSRKRSLLMNYSGQDTEEKGSCRNDPSDDGVYPASIGQQSSDQESAK